MKALATTPSGVGVFLTDGAKVIAIFVDPIVAAAMAMAAQGVKAPRPLTHDLLADILAGLGARVQKVVIHDLKDDTFFARLYLVQENESGRHLLEVDARPSDSIALALRQRAPIYVSPAVWTRAEDMTWALEQAQRKAQQEDGKEGA